MLRGKQVLAYTAGIIDGEGCINITKFNTKSKRGFSYKLVVSVWSTSAWLTQWLKMQYGGSVVPRKTWIGSYPTKKQQWKWQLENRKAKAFLHLILPYLNLKAPEAELGISFQNKMSKWPKTEVELAILEAERLLCSKMKK